MKVRSNFDQSYRLIAISKRMMNHFLSSGIYGSLGCLHLFRIFSLVTGKHKHTKQTFLKLDYLLAFLCEIKWDACIDARACLANFPCFMHLFPVVLSCSINFFHRFLYFLSFVWEWTSMGHFNFAFFPFYFLWIVLLSAYFDLKCKD